MVPRGGEFDDHQVNWLINELSKAPKEKAVVICVHHLPYLITRLQRGSRVIRATLDYAFRKSGRLADMVPGANVNNYQRFMRKFMEHEIVYINAGAGGYHRLHKVQNDHNSRIEVPYRSIDAHDVIYFWKKS